MSKRTLASEKPRLTPFYGKNFNRAKQIAKQYGYKGVSLAHSAINDDPRHPFTPRQVTIITKGYSEFCAFWKKREAEEAALLNTSTTSSGSNSTITGGNIIYKGVTYANATTYSYKKPIPLAKNRDAILFRIASYQSYRIRGLANETETIVDNTIHLRRANEAMTDLWNAMIAMGAAANLVEDAYAVKDGVPFVPLHQGAQDEVTRHARSVRAAMGIIRQAIVAMDVINSEMAAKKEEASVDETTSTSDTTTQAVVPANTETAVVLVG